jgi:hypothetical protein
VPQAHSAVTDVSLDKFPQFAQKTMEPVRVF